MNKSTTKETLLAFIILLSFSLSFLGWLATSPTGGILKIHASWEVVVFNYGCAMVMLITFFIAGYWALRPDR